ncbi:Zn(II)2Cys6 transcription factor domain-containing protein [Aspergillus thermomutatus]|uniref:Zn(2)-C6 fungal-type domain-containing protein n=1 Tax=Aspergillus thermomutatus TaxID=41047 RepID=A0A397HK32_ASPTH|nr:uncharacterized protein CDV56_107813 [Aspergillus thermomutatus]RHZ63445.1 hypothetical protein CDV56_107813 [Aspergillus thermomutatus]
MPVEKHATALAQGSRSRRQKHSCDQCRKSKRACDALCLDLTRRASFSTVDGQRPPCSYCARTKKRCTMEWARSQAQSALKFPRQQPHPERLSRDVLFPWKADEPQAETGSGTWDDLLGTNPWEPANVDLSGSLLDYDSMPLSSIILNDNEVPQEEMQTEMSDALTSARSLSDLLLPDLSSTSDLELDPMCHQTWPSSQASQTSQTYHSLQSTSSKSPWRPSDSAWVSCNQPSSHWNSPQSSLSPFSIDQQMITTSNYHLTSANLLQIYHDVLEHNLSCWVTEMTCPYQRNTTHVVPEWGSSWSNRIYQRTIKLDRVAQSCKLLQLTRSEDQAASKALHLAIMAFATQWAQGSRRHREKYPTGALDHGADEIADGIADEFDRILQHHLWDQAQRALQQVADLESYRVACAELIFGLTQRPWNPGNQTPGYRMEARGRKFAMDSVLSQVRDIIRKEGPPVYLESAARKMHALKYRCDALEKGLGKQCGSREQGAHGIAAMSSEDRATIGLLYWLAIMVDTVSSSMNERPVVVVDEDCQHEAQKEIQQAANMDKSLARSRWDLDLFVQGSLEETHQTHWPCSYEAAAEDVIKSAPVKVLLFRHLSYLQNAIRKGAHEEQIEDIIRSTTALYQYWNKTHGAFFGELVQNYSAVPQRIQSWFVCISAHWHLAALMLADLLEFVDENGLGMEDAACSRITSRMARRTRKHSARELSALARVASPATRDANLGVPQMPDFHHAVNEGTLLTEPWTMILIRAFTKACVIFLGEAEESLRYAGTTLGHNRHNFERNMEQAEDCMKGLWLLGKKSDMARKIAETLSLALGKLRNECGEYQFGLSGL